MEDYQKMIVKKKIKEIQKYAGEGTQLISLYLPPNADRSSVTKQLTDEISQSSNIKSQHTRKNVQAALRRITNYLRQIDFKLPKNGLVLFSGNVSENPSKTDVILLDIEPVKVLTTKLYWCDSSFHTAPLEEQLEHDEVYGIIAVDKREATIALITGKTYRIISSESSGVPGKTRAGGQSSARFERLREKAAESFFKRVGEKVNAAFVEEEKLKGIIVGGPGQTKHDFIEISGLDHRIKDKVLGTVDVGYTDESGIKEILDKGSDILKDLSIVQEKNLVNKFFGEVAKNGLATYGFLEVLEAVKLAKVSSILVSEAIDWTILKFKCASCDKIIPKVVKDKNNVSKVEKEIENNCDGCGGKAELVEEAEFIDFIVDFARPFGTNIEVVSIETPEGSQFYNAFGGIGAFLRYK